MAIARDQKSAFGQVGSGTTVAATWSTNPQAGSKVLVYVQCASTPTSVKDNGSSQSTFIQDKSHTANSKGAFVYRADGISLPASGSYAVTVTVGTSGTIQALGISYTGAAAGAPTASNSGGGTGTAVSTGAAAPAAAGGLAFGGFSDSSGLSAETITFNGSAPQTQQGVDTNGASFWPCAVADALTGSSQTFSWTLGDSVAWDACIVTYDAAGGGSTPISSADTAHGADSGGGPVFGANNEVPWATFQTAMGVSVKGFRGYDSGVGSSTVPTSWPGSSAGPIPSGVPASGCIISYYPKVSGGTADVAGINAGTYDTALATWFATVPSGAYVSLWEEGEADNNAGANFTAAQYIAAHKHIYTLFKAHAPAGAHYGQIVSSASAFTGNAAYPLSNWLCTAANGGSDLDFYGLDVYPAIATETFASHMSTLMGMYSTAGAASNAVYTVAEAGTYSWWTQSTRQSWFNDLWAYAIANGFVHVLTWWNPSSSDSDTVWPPPSAVITELQSEASASLARQGSATVVKVIPPGQTAHGTEAASVGGGTTPHGSDTAHGTEAASVRATLAKGDTAHGTEGASVSGGTTPHGSDTAHGTEGSSLATHGTGFITFAVDLAGQAGNSELGHGSIPPGLTGGAGGPAGPPAPNVGAGWEVKVLAAPDFHTLLAVIPNKVLLTLQFAKQLKDLGSGTVALNMDDSFWTSVTLPNGQPAHYLLDWEHVWQVWQDGVCRFEFLGETVTEQLADPSEQRIATVTGPGTAAALKWAMVAPPGFPGNIRYKLDAITDSFSEVDGSGNLVLDTGLWNAATPSSRISLNPSGSCRLMGSPGTTYLGTTAYDATNTLVSAQVSPIVSPDPAGNSLNGSQVTQMYVQSLANPNYYALMGMSATSLYAQLGGPSGVFTQVIASATAFAAAQAGNQDYQYWQIAETGGQGGGSGTFTFYTSGDGQNWKQQYSVQHNWDATDCGLYFTAKYGVDNTEFATVTGINSNVTTSSLGGPAYYSKPIVGGVWLDQLKQAKARGTIPFIATGQLSSSTDSFGNPWTDSQSVQLANGTDLFTLLGAHASVVNADWVMQPGFLLQVGIPETGKITLGTDRSSTVIFRDGMDCAARSRVRARDQVSNLLAVINSDGRTITADDGTSVSEYGQREAWLQAAMQVTPADLEAVATAADLENATEVLSWTLRVTPYLPGRTIFTGYDVGDWVGLERPDFSAVDKVRVVAIAVQVNADGSESHELTLNSYIQWLQEQFSYIMTKLGGGLVNVAGTTAIASSITSQNSPTVFSLTLGSLGDVASGGPGGNAPLVYDPVTGQWVPAGSDNTITGNVPLSVGGTGGVVTIDGQGGAVTVSAPPAPPGDAGSVAPVPATQTTPTGTTVQDETGTVRVIVGQQLDGTVTVTSVNAPAPGVPDTPTVGAMASSLVVGWDGLLAGASPLSDYLWTEVHLSTTSGFTPSSSTLVATMHAGGIYTVGNLTPGTTYYARLVAVNTSRASSAPSTQASGVPLAASGGNHVTFAATAPSGPANGDVWYDTSNGNEAHQWNGTSWVAYQLGTGAISFTAVSIGGITVFFQGTTPTANNVNDLWYDTSNGNKLNQWNGSSWTAFQWGNGAIAANSITSANIVAGTIVTSDIAAGQITTALIAAGAVTATQIASGTITATQIQAGTITAALLASNIVKSGIVDATTITGSTLQNSSSNPRTSINPDGSLSITNSSGVVVFKVGPDGTMYWYTSGGALLMELQPGGTTLIYAAAVGPQSWDFEGSTQSWTGVGSGTTLTDDTTTWSVSGDDSLKTSTNGAASTWGALSPFFPAVPSTLMSMQCTVYTPTALSALSIGFHWYTSGGSLISSSTGDQGTISTNAGDVNVLTITGASAPSNATQAKFFVQQAATNSSGTAFYTDDVQVAGGLVYSLSPVAGTDGLGNSYDQGLQFTGLAGQTNVFGVQDFLGDTVAKIDGSGNISGQTLSGAVDVLVGGQSVSDLIATAPLGLVNYGFQAVGSTAWPSSAIGTTEIALFELDQNVTGGRIYEFVMNQTIINASGAASCHLYLHYTTDGSTPSTSSAVATTCASRVETASTDAAIGPLRCLFTPASDGTYRFLVSGKTGASTFQFKNDNFIRCEVYDRGTAQAVNNLVVLGSGGSGGNSAQQYTEYFYPLNTYSYYSGSGLRNHNSSMYHGAYSGESDYQYAYIQWNTGSLGNSLSTVLGYTIDKVSLRLTNLHSWYDNGMTFGLHYNTSGNLGGAVGSYSTLLGSFFISEGNTFDFVLGSSVYSNLGGGNWTVLGPDAGDEHNLSWYGYFYGKGSTSQMPRLTVVYTH